MFKILILISMVKVSFMAGVIVGWVWARRDGGRMVRKKLPIRRRFWIFTREEAGDNCIAPGFVERQVRKKLGTKNGPRIIPEPWHR
jgi:hypothetical protein